MRRIGLALAASCLVMLCLPGRVDARKVKVKLATLAPKGTAFHRILETLGNRWTELSEGQVKLKIYPGGVAGDEIEVIRKIRLGTLSAGLVTSTGMADIDRAINALQIPMAYGDAAELDFVRSRMEPSLEKIYADAGFVVLAWAEAGWVRFLSVSRIVEPADAHALKMMINAGNPEQVEVWRSGGFKPVPLPASEITTALQTGLIEAVPTTPQAMMMLRWYEHANFFTDDPWSPLVGALIIDRKVWETIDAGLRPKLLAAARQAGEKLRAEVRANEKRALDEMKQRGLQLVSIDAATRAKWKAMVDGMRGALRGAYVPPAMWDEAHRHLAAYRKMGAFTDGKDE